MRRDDILKVSGVSPDQCTAWSACAAAAGLPTAAWMREAATVAAASDITAADLLAELVRLRADLARGTGNNLNQIAHALNTDLKAGKLPDAAAHERSLGGGRHDPAGRPHRRGVRPRGHGQPRLRRWRQRGYQRASGLPPGP